MAFLWYNFLHKWLSSTNNEMKLSFRPRERLQNSAETHWVGMHCLAFNGTPKDQWLTRMESSRRTMRNKNSEPELSLSWHRNQTSSSLFFTVSWNGFCHMFRRSPCKNETWKKNSAWSFKKASSIKNAIKRFTTDALIRVKSIKKNWWNDTQICLFT